jgi:glycosyltransferase involved in cell wall biosynthesis
MWAGVPLKAIWWDAKKVNSEFPVARYDADVECTVSIINARWRPPSAVLRMCEWRSSAVLGYFQCEATLVPQNLRDLHRSFDAMLATARSTRDAIMQSGYAGPVFVFGHGVDPAQFPHLDRPVGRTPYTFFHLADVQWRKGTDVLINVFRSLPHPDIRLYIKAQWRNKEVPGYEKLCGGDPRIVWDFRCYPPDELAGLMAKMDCGVFPSRGEGFGLPKIEWEATGGPCIATDAFGYKDTSVPGGTILLSGKRIVAQIDAGEQVEPDPDHLRELMLWCLGNRERAAQRGRTAGANIHANWKWSDKIAELLEFLEQFGLKTGTRPLRVTA